jgi:hypothetical protein
VTARRGPAEPHSTVLKSVDTDILDCCCIGAPPSRGSRFGSDQRAQRGGPRRRRRPAHTPGPAGASGSTSRSNRSAACWPADQPARAAKAAGAAPRPRVSTNRARCDCLPRQPGKRGREPTMEDRGGCHPAPHHGRLASLVPGRHPLSASSLRPGVRDLGAAVEPIAAPLQVDNSPAQQPRSHHLQCRSSGPSAP